MSIISEYKCKVNVARNISAADKKRLEVQGYGTVNDALLSHIKYWLRLTPASCVLWVLTGTYLRSPFVLICFVPVAIAGAISPINPFDLIYNYGLRYLVKGFRLPPLPMPRRFSCLLAATMVTVSACSFQFGFSLIGYIVGGFSFVTGVLQITTGFCIPSFIYAIVFGVRKVKRVKGYKEYTL